jgi:hypothetical protein
MLQNVKSNDSPLPHPSLQNASAGRYIAVASQIKDGRTTACLVDGDCGIFADPIANEYFPYSKIPAKSELSLS